MDRDRDAAYIEHFRTSENRLRAVRSLLIDVLGTIDGIRQPVVAYTAFAAATVGPEEMAFTQEDSEVFCYARERFAACAAVIELDEVMRTLDPNGSAEMTKQIRAARNAYAHGCLQPSWKSVYKHPSSELGFQKNSRAFSEVEQDDVMRIDHGGLAGLLMWANQILEIAEKLVVGTK